MTAPVEIVGFMHVARVNDWRAIVDEQLFKLHASGLWERSKRIFVGFVGNDDGAADFHLPDKCKVVYDGSDVAEAERPTLVALQDYCRGNNCLVYYIHTKGVINTSQGTREWRHSMEHFVIHRHQACIDQLADHDICGINWADRGWCRFFGGNFWWARSEYIRTLPDLATMQPIPGRDPGSRYVCERWIGENPAVRPACLFDSLTDHYASQPLPRSRYAQVCEVSLPQNGRARAIAGTLWDGLENRFQDLLDPVDPIRNVAQLGVGDGYALYCLSAALPRARVIVVDPHRKPSADFLSLLPNVVFGHECESLPEIGMTIDVLHVGRELNLPSADREFETWISHVRPGGCVIVSGANQDGWFINVAGRKVKLNHRSGLGAWYKGKAERKLPDRAPQLLGAILPDSR